MDYPGMSLTRDPMLTYSEEFSKSRELLISTHIERLRTRNEHSKPAPPMTGHFIVAESKRQLTH
jgi:hypothetical protein